MQHSLWLGACALLAFTGLWGQEQSDPPARVGRISFLEGAVTLQPAGADDWTAAELNYPLTIGDRLWADGGAYVEVRVGATAIHLAPQTAFTFSLLDDTVARVGLSQGTAYVRIPALSEGEMVDVDTPNAAISLVQPGSYRIDVDVDHNTTSVTVRVGAAQLMANGRTVYLRPGRLLQVRDDQQLADAMDALPPDEWEQWCAAGDQRAEQFLLESDSYVAPGMPGAEDLAAYGQWSIDATFGAVWCPAEVASGWAPYRNGHWVYIAPWGWTWVDRALWGFAPFHFGRWVFTRGHWIWIPGRRTQHPVYAPALVAFVGGPDVSTTVAGRRRPFSAWIPLGPGEVYRPNYTASYQYVRRVNGPDFRVGSTSLNAPLAYRNREHTITVQTEAPALMRPPSASPPAAAWRPVIERSGWEAAQPSGVRGEEAAQQRFAPQPVDLDQKAVEPEAIDRQSSHLDHLQRVQRQRSKQPRAETSEQQRAEQLRAEQQQAEQHRAEQRRVEQQRTEQLRAEQQRAEQQRAEQQRAEEAKKADDARKKL